ncbi:MULTISPECIES: hypothetical protein [Bacillus amyloliquefaciens group]
MTSCRRDIPNFCSNTDCRHQMTGPVNKDWVSSGGTLDKNPFRLRFLLS